MHNLEVESYVLFGGHSEDFKPGDRTLKSLWGTAAKRQWGSQDLQVFLQQRPGSRNIKRLLLFKENQISQVKEFSTFLCMGRCKSLSSLKAFLWCAPQLLGASILCFLILSFFRVHCRGGRVLQHLTAGWRAILPPSWVPPGPTVGWP